MVGVLEGMAYVHKMGEAGRARGTENRLARLASQAYGAPVDQQRGLVQQAIGTDPQSGFALGKSLGDDRQQRMTGLSQKARLLVGYAKAGNRQGVDGLYPQLAQEAQALGLAPNIPTAWDDSYLPGIEQLAMMGGAGNGAPRVQSRFVGEDGQVYAMMADSPVPVPTGIKADRHMWFRDHPGMAPELVGKDGLSRPVGAPSAQPQAEGPTRATMEADVELANAMVAAGIPSEQIDAFLAARGQRASQMSAAQPQQGAQARPSEAQIAAQTEAAKLGVQMQFAPQQQAIETQGAVNRASQLAPIETAAAISRTRGTEMAKAESEALASLPQTIQTADETIALLTQALNHPGRTVATGLSGTLDPRNYVPGTDARDFRVLLDQIGGRAFLQAFESLKGGGQITEIEGRKATEAMARLNTAQSDEAFEAALKELIGIAQKAKTNALRRASSAGSGMYGPAPADAPPSNAIPAPGHTEGGYRFRGGNPADPSSWERV